MASQIGKYGGQPSHPSHKDTKNAICWTLCGPRSSSLMRQKRRSRRRKREVGKERPRSRKEVKTTNSPGKGRGSVSDVGTLHRWCAFFSGIVRFEIYGRSEFVFNEDFRHIANTPSLRWVV